MIFFNFNNFNFSTYKIFINLNSVDILNKQFHKNYYNKSEAIYLFISLFITYKSIQQKFVS